MWLDTHQGAGLLGLAAGTGVRLLPVLSQPGAGMELEVLWQLALQWQRLGYSVLVLDATAQESAHTPGLAQWLADGARADAGPEDTQAPRIVPAALGLRQLLARHPDDAMQVLAPLLRSFGVAVLHAPPTSVAALLRGRDASPLVIAAPGEAGLLRGYSLLKQMAAHGAWRCTVAAVVPPGVAAYAVQRALDALRQNCQQWLEMAPRGALVRAHDAAAFAALALQLLEGACTRDARHWPARAGGAASTYYPGAWSH